MILHSDLNPPSRDVDVRIEQAGERAATLMSLIESDKLNGHDAWAYLKDVLTKLPTWSSSRLVELLPHRWVGPVST